MDLSNFAAGLGLVVINQGLSAKKKEISAVLATLLHNFEEIGYGFTQNSFNILSGMSDEDIIGIYNEYFPVLSDLIGSSYYFKPFYPNFPKEVMEYSKVRQYVDQIIHYWTGFIPPEIEDLGTPYYGKVQVLKLLEVVSFETVVELIKATLLSKSSLKPTQVDEFRWFVAKYPEYAMSILPEDFDHQEVMAMAIGALVNQGVVALDDLRVIQYYNSPTSVLRVLVAMQLGDISLAKRSKFPRMTNSLKRQIITALESVDGEFYEELVKHSGKWKVVFKNMFAGEYAKRHPKFFQLVQYSRGNLKTKTFNGLIESYLEANLDLSETQSFDLLRKAVTTLQTRPTLHARSLDRLLRLHPNNQDFILDSFQKIASKVSSRALYQIIGAYRSRDIQQFRVFMPKGPKSTGSVQLNNFEPLQDNIRMRILNICSNALVYHYSALSELQNVFVCPKLKAIALPLSLRSASKAVRTVGRGSKLDLGNSDHIRTFIQWQDPCDGESADMDLSMTLVNENWEKVHHLYYGNRLDSIFDELGLYHSGDLTSAPAPNGASEFIDCHIPTLLANGIRYLVMDLRSYPGVDTLAEGVAGWMMRDGVDSGEPFEPRTVQMKFDLNTTGTNMIPVVFDLLQRQANWIDVSANQSYSTVNNILNDEIQTGVLVQALVQRQFPTLYDLFIAHANARGVLVQDARHADVIFDTSDSSAIKYWDAETILTMI